MKRLSITAMLPILLWLLFSASTTAESVPIEGEWFFTEAVSGGVHVSAAELGIDGSIELRADGSAVYRFGGEVLDGITWTGNGTNLMLHRGNAALLTLKVCPDGTLSAERDNVVYVFARENGAVRQGFDPDPDATAEMYIGEWYVSGMRTGGTYAALTPDSLDMRVTITEKYVTVCFGAQPGTTVEYSAEGSTLRVKDGDGTVTFFLCENDALGFTVSAGTESETTYYLTRQA